MQYQFTDIREKFKNLPDNIQDAISSVSVGNAMEEIGKKHRLHIDQMNELFDETGLIMLGLTHPKDYIRNLEKRLVIDADTVKRIAADVNEQIFRPIRESLKKIHNISDRNQEKLNAERSTLNATTVEHPILRLKKTSEEARVVLSKKEIPRQFREPEGGGNIIGWPVRDESRIKNQELRTEKLDKPEEQKSVQAEKPFFKITPTEKIQDTRYKIQDTKTWAPEQPEKEALAPLEKSRSKAAEAAPSAWRSLTGPAPQNLPIETETDTAPPTGAYPKKESVEPPLQETRAEELPYAQNVQKKAAPRETQLGKIIKNEKLAEKEGRGATTIVEKKLSGSFKLPRTETEYKEKATQTSPSQKYGGGDPYRESVN